MSKSTINARCAYCTTMIRIVIDGALECPKREAIVAPKVFCRACESTFEVMIKTRRKSKGRKIKAVEAKRKAELAEKVVEAKARNEELAKKLLAEPGCTCAEYARTPVYNSDRSDGLDAGYTTNGIPGPPRHRYGCPARRG